MSWEIEEDFSGVNPAVNRTGEVPPETGPYQVEIEETELRETQAGNNRVAMFLITTGPKGMDGYEFMDGLNVPSGKHADTQRRFWLTLFMSLGYSAKKLQKKMKIGPKQLEGKTGYVYFTTREDNSDSEYYDVKWITENQYKKLIAKQAKRPKKQPEPVAEDDDLPEEPDVSEEADDDEEDPLDVLDI